MSRLNDRLGMTFIVLNQTDVLLLFAVCLIVALDLISLKLSTDKIVNITIFYSFDFHEETKNLSNDDRPKRSVTGLITLFTTMIGYRSMHR